MPPIWLLGIMARSGIAARFQKAAAWLVAVLFVLVVAGLLFVVVKESIARNRQENREEAVTLDRAEVDAAANAAIVGAYIEADGNALIREATTAQNEKEIDREVQKADNSVAGAGVRSVLDRVREQQAAGRR